MKVLILNGSPRVGGNTTVAVEEMERSFWLLMKKDFRIRKE